MTYPRPGTSPCPYCGLAMECDEVDVGVGMVQCGPYLCDFCGASEMGPEKVYPNQPRPFTEKDQIWWDSTTEEERATGFYRNGRHSPYANTILGKPVSYIVAKAAYRMGILDEKPS